MTKSKPLFVMSVIALIAGAIFLVAALFSAITNMLGSAQQTNETNADEEVALLAEVNDCLGQVSDLRTQIADNQTRVEVLIAERSDDSSTWWMNPLTGVGTDLQLAGECLEAMSEELKTERERNLADGMSPEERISALRTGISGLKDDITKYEKAAAEYLALVDEIEAILTGAIASLPELSGA